MNYPFNYQTITNNYFVTRYVRLKFKTDKELKSGLGDFSGWAKVGLNDKSYNDRENIWIKVPVNMRTPNQMPINFGKYLSDYIMGEPYSVVAADLEEDSEAHKLFMQDIFVIDDECNFINAKKAELTSEEKAAKEAKEARRRTLQRHNRKMYDMCIQCQDKNDPRWKAEGYNLRYGR